MYVQKHFQQTDTDTLFDVIRDYPLATLITVTDQGLEANHIPFCLNQTDGKNRLQGHLAKGNPLWKNLPGGSEVLVVFQGPHAYISPSHYPTKQETGMVVPTWNYIAVHVRGTLQYRHDPEWCQTLVENLTNQQEARQDSPWAVSDAPQTYIDKMLAAVVGIEIEITDITGKWKVSQNQPERNQLGVAEGLSRDTNTEVQKMAAVVGKRVLAS